MFASVRRYRLESGSIDDLLHLVDTDFAESVEEMDGFMEYQVLECGNGEIITITTLKDRRSAEASMEASADWIRDTLARQFDLKRLEAFVGEIAISRAREEVTVVAMKSCSASASSSGASRWGKWAARGSVTNRLWGMAACAARPCSSGIVR